MPERDNEKPPTNSFDHAFIGALIGAFLLFTQTEPLVENELSKRQRTNHLRLSQSIRAVHEESRT